MMNVQVKTATAKGANIRKADLLHELQQGSGMLRRQEILKTLWRLERQSTVLEAPRAERAPLSNGAQSQTQRPSERVNRDKQSAPEMHDNSPQASENAICSDEGVLSQLNDKQLLQILNQICARLKYSLACYLRYAKPWGAPADERIREMIRWIGDEQLAFVDQIGSFILDRRGRIESGSFPIRFTAYNDLSPAYLAPLVLVDLEQLVDALRPLTRMLASDPDAHVLVMEILGAIQAQCDTLRERIEGETNNRCHRPPSARLNERCSENVMTTAATAA